MKESLREDYELCKNLRSMSVKKLHKREKSSAFYLNYLVLKKNRNEYYLHVAE